MLLRLFTIITLLFFNINLNAQRELIAKFGTSRDNCWEHYQYLIYSDDTFEYFGGFAYGSGSYSLNGDTFNLVYSGDSFKNQFTIERELIDSNFILIDVLRRPNNQKVFCQFFKLIVKKEGAETKKLNCEYGKGFNLGELENFQNSKFIKVEGIQDYFINPSTYEEIDSIQSFFNFKFKTPLKGTKFTILINDFRQKRVIYKGIKETIIILEKSSPRWRVNYFFQPHIKEHYNSYEIIRE